MPYYYFHDSNKGYLEYKCEKLKESFYREVMQPKVEVYVTKEPVPYSMRESGEYKVLKTGDNWGDLWDCGWFHLTGRLEKEQLKGQLTLYLDVNGEACVYDRNGCPVKGLTTNNSRMVPTLGNVGKNIYELPDGEIKDGTVDIWVDAGCNDLFKEQIGILNKAVLTEKKELLRELYYDFAVLLDLTKTLNTESARYQKIIVGLTKASMLLKDFTEEEAKEAFQFVKPLITQPSSQTDFKVTAIGHAHLDLCWTWPLRETIRKAARSFSTVLYHMDRYEDYIFGASQMQLYAWIEKRYPELFGKIKKRIKEGRWEVQGGMWCESDLNVTGGESLIRQFLYGMEYARNKLGKEVNVCWLPDTFGYTGSFPQIMKKSGIEYFCIQKIRTTSAYRKYPHDTFYWEGIDGTRILTSVPPVIYGCGATPVCISESETGYKDKAATDSVLMLFGQGDGGGGAGAEHLECLKREKSLNGLVPTVQDTALNFFRETEKHKEEIKTWSGPMDLDRHTGTLTTSGKSKYYNHTLENLLQKTELLGAMAYIREGVPYPYKALEKIWRGGLLYQFHDILPGTSISRVYNESHAHYEEMLQELNALYAKLKEKLMVSNIKAVYNPSQYERQEWIKMEGQWKYVSVRPYSCKTAEERNFSELKASVEVLENELLRIYFQPDGTIGSIVDLEVGREVLTGSSNTLMVYIDSMENGSDPWASGSSAWDFSDNYRDKLHENFQLIGIIPVIDGPKASLRMEYQYGQSVLTQDVSIMQGSRRIDFKTSCDWKETGRMLRTNFKVNFAANEMTRGIQFGAVKEPLHNNTEWEAFKSEVVGQKYVDISDNDYGVALLSDYKYGYHPGKGELDLCLLRSTEYPAKDLDKGKQEFTYSLFMHKGNVTEGEVVKESYLMNYPLEIGIDMGEVPLFEIDRGILESVKCAQQKDGIIVRVYEPDGHFSAVTLKVGFPFWHCYETDLLENEIRELEGRNNEIQLDLKPFEIITLKFCV